MKEKDIVRLIKRLVDIPTVSGFEIINAEKIVGVIKEYTSFFNEIKITESGSIIAIHHSDKMRAKKLLFDAHIDTVGMIVTEICEGGFLRTLPIGGIDKRLLFSSKVEIYGKKTIEGVFISTPPHLASGEDKLPKFDEILIDTGIAEEELKKLVSVGTPCGFCGKTEALLNGKIISKSLDDKICVCAILLAAKLLSESEDYSDDIDLYALFSSSEETGGAGIKTASYIIDAHAAIVLDVNFAQSFDIPKKDSIKMGGGAGISYSASISRKMTDYIITLAKDELLSYTAIVEAKNTGTNAHSLQIANLGTPCAVMSIPLKYMHTGSEEAKISDVVTCSEILFHAAKNFSLFGERKTYIKAGGSK